MIAFKQSINTTILQNQFNYFCYSDLLYNRYEDQNMSEDSLEKNKPPTNYFKGVWECLLELKI